MIRRTPKGWKVLSEAGKPLSKDLPSEKAAKKRLQQVEFFKHRPKVKRRRTTKGA